MASLKKNTLAINKETGCSLRVTRDCTKSIGENLILSNRLKYVIKEIHTDRIIVEYAEPFGG